MVVGGFDSTTNVVVVHHRQPVICLLAIDRAAKGALNSHETLQFPDTSEEEE